MIALDRVADMRAWADEARRAGRRIGFVPTMGYLHEGHLSLVRLARQETDACVVSVFVNPLQFGANEDLDRYPRDGAGDRAKLESESVDVLYMPPATAMYGPEFQTRVSVSEVSQGLCGQGRPGHFNGVTTVVAKLFNAVRPDVAVFGEKDYQQLATIRRMVSDLDWGIEVVGGAIVREDDGLAMSSRNAYLSADERAAAVAISRSLGEARRTCRGGERSASAVLGRVREVIAAQPLLRIEYAEIVDPETIRPVEEVGPALLAVAVRVGKTRLIDNTLLTAG